MRLAIPALLFAATLPRVAAVDLAYTITSYNGGTQSLVSWTISGDLASPNGYALNWATSTPSIGTGWNFPVATPMFKTQADRDISVSVPGASLYLRNINTSEVSTSTVLRIQTWTGMFAGENVMFTFGLNVGASDLVRIFPTNGSAVIDVAFSEFNAGSYNVGYLDFGSVTVAGGAVPEPSTYGLALGGLALVGAVIRRRRK